MPSEDLHLTYNRSTFRIAYALRRTQKSDLTVVFLHGLGCSGSDFRAAFHHPGLTEYSLLTFDLPGCGDTPYPQNQTLNIDDLVELTHLILAKLQLQKVVLVGHSMGGLLALLYTERYPTTVRGFVNIEGNLAPEDCFFSRLVAHADHTTVTTSILPKLRDRLQHAQNTGLRAYAANLERASPEAYHDYSPSLVHYSDTGNLLQRYLALDIPTLFLYGDENRSLSYLPRLKDSGCTLLEIPASGHFPFHDNPAALYHALATFLTRVTARPD